MANKERSKLDSVESGLKRHRLHRMKNAIEHWLLPSTCVLSGQSAQRFDLSSELLAACERPKLNEVCGQCCEPSLDGQLCGACLTNPPAYCRTQVGFYFAEPVATLIYDFKYHQKSAYARLLAELLVESIDASGVQALVPIPAHPLRRRQRGYNQAELLAKELGALLNLPVYARAIKRIKHTPTQTQLSAKQRQQNLRSAFDFKETQLYGLTQIALIDDVITTGATMQRVAELVTKHSDIQNVQAWAVAKTK